MKKKDRGSMETTVVTEGSKLKTTQTGKERERFSKLYGIFIEKHEGATVLILRNFPSQRIMNEWLEASGWKLPERRKKYVIMRGVPMEGLKVFKVEEVAAAPIMAGVSTQKAPTTPRVPAAPKPVVPVTSEETAENLNDDSEDDVDDDLIGPGGVSL